MTRNIFSILLICAILCGSARILCGEDAKIVIAFDKAYPPYMYGTLAQPQGLYPTLIQAVFTRMGVPVELQALPWKRALLEGESGNMAIGGIYKNTPRLAVYDYSDPIFTEHLLVYVKKGQGFPFNTIADLQGKTIGINAGWSYGEAFDAARQNHLFVVQETVDNLANFHKLALGRVDCIIVDQVSAAQIIRQEQLGEQVEPCAQPVAVNEAYLVFAKHAQQQSLLAQFNATLAEMKPAGVYQKLIDEFMASTIPK